MRFARLESGSMPWAGLAAGPTAWALNTQIAYAVAPLACGTRAAILTPVAVVLVVAAAAGALLSWRAAQVRMTSEWFDLRGGRPHRFLAWIGLAAGVLFALVVANQAAATLILDGCWQ
jgi:hypothetical protein